MVYVQRDERRRILRVEQEPFDSMSQSMPADDPEVQAWLASHALNNRLVALQQSDLEMIRVLEDVVSALVSRGVIRYTDLPEAARRKLSQRAETRAELEGLGSLLGGDEPPLR
ncbi:tryptophan synthase subunit beta [Pseudomonas benzenivorans]|uniref:Tryptophan synthase subunit beta n=1 Tax=Pseudomonas benzenivorans TaxID=556533 RepID=A0ABY5H6F5_9PSED|nr:tryptophan synthase subunit beta [Pseudomonas benzenivorans]UTW07432.1 tryptophan synthase subunit beta [Pseudomonas benzenivorans]